jgi:hypothetical protein
VDSKWAAEPFVSRRSVSRLLYYLVFCPRTISYPFSACFLYRRTTHDKNDGTAISDSLRKSIIWISRALNSTIPWLIQFSPTD